jgi:hypothetical protein
MKTAARTTTATLWISISNHKQANKGEDGISRADRKTKEDQGEEQNIRRR